MLFGRYRHTVQQTKSQTEPVDSSGLIENKFKNPF